MVEVPLWPEVIVMPVELSEKAEAVELTVKGSEPEAAAKTASPE